MKLRKLLLASALATSFALSGAAPASAADLGGDCNGSVDTNCRYCSYAGGNVGYSNYYCQQYGYPWYFQTCAVWVANNCIVG